MKIVITDGDTLNPGDLDWRAIEEMGEMKYYGTTPNDLVAERCAEADIIVANKTVIPGDFIRSSKQLKMIAVSATGFNNVDVNAAKEAGVVVSNVPEYGTYSVAQHCFALLLELMNHVGEHAASVKKGEWARSGSWSYTLKPLTELKGKVLGIVGFGRIGRQVAVIGSAFGMEVIFNNRSVVQDSLYRQVELDELFRNSDVVSLHCPLTAENKGFVNLDMLSRMKRTAVLINTSRGALVNEDHLVEALNRKLISAAALDVLCDEPPRMENALVRHPDCMVTPHIAWVSREARKRLMDVTVENIRGFMNGKPQNVVSQ